MSSMSALVFFIIFINYSTGSPFLYNVARVITSASSASSSPQNSENIADLRKLQRSQLAKQVQPLDDDDFSFNEDPQTNNGFVPNLIQKKVSKILRKFSYITMFANSGNNPTNVDDEFDKEKNDFDKEYDVDENRNGTIMGENDVSNVTFSLPTLGDDGNQSGENALFDENGRIEETTQQRSGINGFKRNVYQKQELFNDTNVPSKFSSIGYYFTELLGSLIGLIYGATAQLNRPNAAATQLPTL